MKILIDKEVGAQDSNGETAMTKAVKYGKKDCAALLLDKEQNMKDNNGHDANWYAGDKSKEGERVQDGQCCKDLFDAAKKGCEKCCRRYIGQARRTRDDIRFNGLGSETNRTALMVAAFYGKTGCVRILAEKEAGRQDGYDGHNRTALMLAARNGHLECVMVLASKECGKKD